MFRRSRSSTGASLILVIAIFGTLALLIMLFCVNFTGFIGSYHEQRSAIEAAALAAAKDLSAIVIQDDNFGYIGLSDASPIGTSTTAGDGYYTSCTGINTLFGTIRLDLIIADYLGDPMMRQMALTDYTNALNAQTNLVKALNTAIAPGGTGADVNGNTINPTTDATNAYTSNNIHLTVGQTSSLVPGSLKLAAGYVDGLATRTPAPAPQAIDPQSPGDQSLGFYLPNVTINYTSNLTYPTTASATTAFEFCSLGANATLVDFRAFQSTADPGLPYSTPTVVKVDANEQFTIGGAVNHTVHATAAALAGTVVDQRPDPGAFSITCTDTPVPEIQHFVDIINNTQMQANPTDVMQTTTSSSSPGDYPESATLTGYSMPFMPDPDPAHPKFQNVLSVALYDWIRRGGTNVNVQDLISAMQSTLLSVSSTGPQQHLFHIKSSGSVTQTATASSTYGTLNMCVSNNQFRAISGMAIVSSNGNNYDCQITDYVRVPGKKYGGIHAGEPLDLSPGAIVRSPFSASSYAGPSMYENTTWKYQEFLTGSGAVRPTYNSDGISVDVTFRMRH